MGNGEQPPKIGIGPEGRLGGLIQFLVIAILGIVIFVYSMDPVTILMKIIPVTLIMLIVLGHLVLMGDNLPLAPPGGNWTPAKSRLIPGCLPHSALGAHYRSHNGLYRKCIPSVADKPAFTVVWRHRLLHHTPLWDQLELLAFQGKNVSLGNHGHRIHRRDDHLGDCLEFYQPWGNPNFPIHHLTKRVLSRLTG
jgi:hypothetical protein